MLATLLSSTLVGLDGRIIRVEVDVAPGLPGFTIVGLADAALQEARERVRGAIRNAGFSHPPRRITVNLAPADLRKAGASLDLAIAIGILLGSEQVVAAPGRIALIGELSLGGEVASVPGILPMTAALARRGIRRVIVPADTVPEASLVAGMEIVGVGSLRDAADSVRRRVRRTARPVPPRIERAEDAWRGSGIGRQAADPPREPAAKAPAGGGQPGSAIHVVEMMPDLAEVRGQLEARRALEIALAGGHGLLLVGPPGTGKTLLARTIPGLLPPLDDRDALAATVIASAAGEGPIDSLRRIAPVRTPHHTLSYAAMVGGGPRMSPGEVTRADNGVLFLDELPEFGRDVLEALRQPLEDGHVSIARVGWATRFPARFQLVAAMNPCPCGFAGDGTDRCRCGPGVADRYAGRISGPLRDRIDLWVTLGRVPPGAMIAGREPEGSAVVAARIATARAIQATRRPSLNGRLSGRALRAACGLSSAALERAIALADLEALSGRGTERVLRVARTIADLAGAERVATEHLDEAARFRSSASGSLAREAS